MEFNVLTGPLSKWNNIWVLTPLNDSKHLESWQQDAGTARKLNMEILKGFPDSSPQLLNLCWKLYNLIKGLPYH